jgi:hypothetical protein
MSEAAIKGYSPHFEYLRNVIESEW